MYNVQLLSFRMRAAEGREAQHSEGLNLITTDRQGPGHSHGRKDIDKKAARFATLGYSAYCIPVAMPPHTLICIFIIDWR